MRFPRRQATRIAVALGVLVLLPLGTLFLSAQPAASDPGRQRCRYGIHVRELRDIDLSRDNFTATFVLWSLCDENRRVGPADFLWTVNGTELKKSLVRKETTPAGHWRAVKVTGTFNKTWSMARYPFDHQTLQLVIGAGYTSPDDTTATVDAAHSGIVPDLAAEGLHVRGFTVRPGYLSTDFAEGNPAYKPGTEVRWNIMTVTIDTLQIIGLLYACASAGVAALTWVRITQGATEGWVRRFNRWSLILTTAAFVVLSALTVVLAMRDSVDENVMRIPDCPDRPGACIFWRQPHDTG